MREIIDITVELNSKTPLYPGDPIPEIQRISSIKKGDSLTISQINLPLHIGTHVDLPGHFLADGKMLGDFDIDAFIGPAYIIDMSDVEHKITRDRMKKEQIPPKKHIFLKTRNSEQLSNPNFFEEYVYLTESATKTILETQPRSIGIDYYSLDPLTSTMFPSHRCCAQFGIPVFVCLNLFHVHSGGWQFAGLPLRLPSVEGAPVRAVIWKS